MMDFIYKLYGYDNFTLYLTIAIVVLVILFVLVLIFGKKDQKLEETKRLQKLELEKAFKEEQTEPIKVETEAPVVEEMHEELQVMNMSTEEEIEMPDIPEIKEETPVLVNENVDANVTVFEPTVKEDEEIPEVELPRKEISSTKDIEEESAPINVDDIPSFNFDEINDSIEKGLNEIENIKNEFNSIEVPTMEETEVVKEEVKPVKTYQPSKVFSSVYVSDETKPEEIKMDEPVVNVEPQIKVEEPIVKPQPTLIVQDEEDDFDMPTLRIMDEAPVVEQKLEEVVPVIPEPVVVPEPVKIEEPKKEEIVTDVKEVGTISFDDLIGETYKIQ